MLHCSMLGLEKPKTIMIYEQARVFFPLTAKRQQVQSGHSPAMKQRCGDKAGYTSLVAS